MKDFNRREFLKSLSVGTVATAIPNKASEKNSENSIDTTDPALARAIEQIKNEAIANFTRVKKLNVDLEECTQEESDEEIKLFTEEIEKETNLETILRIRNNYSKLEMHIRMNPENKRKLEIIDYKKIPKF